MAHFRVIIKDLAPSFACGPEQNVLAAMVSAGARPLPVGCRGGGCGICRVRVLSGAVEREAMSRSHVTVEDEREGIALACKLYPRSDLVIEPARRRPSAAK